VWLFNIILIITDSFGCVVALCGCFIMRIMLLSVGFYFLALLFVKASALAYCNHNGTQCNEDCNVLNVCRLQKL
jgi:hypothetical protein